jgi:exopolysaccharide biosynthesis protein
MRIFIKILLASLFIFLTFLFLTKHNSNQTLLKSPQEETKDFEDDVDKKTYSYSELENTNYVFNYIKVSNPDNIELYSNLDEKLASYELMDKTKCSKLVSSGFYTEEGNHIGLFISDYEVLSKSVNNQTFDGFFSINKDSVVISRKIPPSPRLAVQSGPLLLYEGKSIKIVTKKEDEARRVIVALSESKDIWFFVIYNKDSLFLGPTMDKLPDILAELENKLDIKFTNALNLDGGTHSAFYSDGAKIQELSPIGGYFCIQ